MKIYKLTLNEVAADPLISVSSYVNPRTERKVQYYATKELAETAQKEIYDGFTKLVGFVPRVEAIITEINVNTI